MRQALNIRQDLEFVDSFHFVLQAYQEISAMKMNQIRQSVILTRDYLKALSEVFHQVKVSYQRQVENVERKQQKQEQKSAKKAAVLLSANTKLYGTIVRDVFNSYVNFIQSHPEHDLIIVGKIGAELFTQAGLKRRALFVSIPDILAKMDDLKEAIQILKDYDEVAVFHGQFESTMRQEPVLRSITGDQILALNEGNKAERLEYAFEPDLPNIVTFFKTAAVNSLFKQTVHEAHLARLASRIKAMEEGLTEIHHQKKNLLTERRRFNKAAEHKKQLEQFASISLWR